MATEGQRATSLIGSVGTKTETERKSDHMTRKEDRRPPQEFVSSYISIVHEEWCAAMIGAAISNVLAGQNKLQRRASTWLPWPESHRPTGAERFLFIFTSAGLRSPPWNSADENHSKSAPETPRRPAKTILEPSRRTVCTCRHREICSSRLLPVACPPRGSTNRFPARRSPVLPVFCRWTGEGAQKA